ncbi:MULTISPECIES: hypothetical protein [unclassified Cellulosimicrobium]|uniref:Uncharacterized protein n=1 Tax=Cellulosimicrobium sp. ES-005 TaxID=3163031 RepID=A0AAU8FW10_9MICO|nr:hypothetical protein [Cellulosimicrobium sp. TH-20]
MRFTARGEEWKSALAVMEMDGYKDGQAMAKAVVAAVYGDLVMRESFLLLVREAVDKRPIGYGPFPSEAEAEKLGAALGLPYAIEPITGSGVLEANLEGRDFGGYGYCKAKGCGHPPWLHLADGSSRGPCTEGGCPCKKHRK